MWKSEKRNRQLNKCPDKYLISFCLYLQFYEIKCNNSKTIGSINKISLNAFNIFNLRYLSSFSFCIIPFMIIFNYTFKCKFKCQFEPFELESRKKNRIRRAQRVAYERRYIAVSQASRLLRIISFSTWKRRPWINNESVEDDKSLCTKLPESILHSQLSRQIEIRNVHSVTLIIAVYSLFINE